MKQLPATLLLSLFLLCPIRSHAQDTTSFDGKKALTFSFNGFNLSGGLGGKYWLNKDYALRVIITGSYDQSKDLTDETRYTSASLGLTAYLNRHFQTDQALSPYTGVGCGLAYDYYNAAYSAEPSRTLSIKIPLLVGLEYWLTRAISLAGEQNITFNLRVSRTSREYKVANSTSTVLLSVYF